MCVYVCVCGYVRACVRASVHVRVCACVQSKPSGVLSGFFGRRSSSEAMGRESSVLQHALDRIDELERRVISMDCVQSRNGVLIWKVDDFARRRLNALSGWLDHVLSSWLILDVCRSLICFACECVRTC